MKNLKVATKLLVGFMIVTVLSIVLAGVGILSSTSINGNYGYLLDSPVTRERSLHDMQLQFTMLRYRSANFAMEAGNTDIIQNTLTPQFEDAANKFSESINAYLENNANDMRQSAADRDMKNTNALHINELVEQFKADAENVRQLGLAGDATGATEALRAVIPITNEINGLIEELIVPAMDMVERESASMNDSAMMFTMILIGVAVVCVIISIVLAIVISRMISKPLVVLSEFMKKAGTTGNVTLRQEDINVIGKLGSTKDEIGQVISNTGAFVNHVNKIADVLTTVSNGDLTPAVQLLSHEDTMGVALNTMTENLNATFKEFNAASSQVSLGATQVADGAQALAQGSTQQAASTEELSSSIAEVAEKTKVNAELANKSANLAGDIKANAEKGSRQMDDMVAAVKDINDASQSIGMVIKTIDDIAFQTNILALNAAVEAARAGQHGKGFAVVADEVRSLAAKSSAAAKDTETLIANSISKAELGGRIAAETATSLSEIVTGINESEQLITNIARSSEEQSAGIGEINIGIDQVAQVVQQNSATAEQSAAAAQEMSSQSDLLREMIARFRLRDMATGIGAPQQAAPAMAQRGLPQQGQTLYNDQPIF